MKPPEGFAHSRLNEGNWHGGFVERAILGGGCFWCLEAVFDMVEGVQEVKSGYAGGTVENPTYKHVCEGTTGHAEVVAVEFDPTVIGYRDLLEIFFGMHDPTTLNRQGNDVGTQYRSAIFFESEAQREAAEAVIAALGVDGPWDGPIVTEVTPLDVFYEAEDYHDDYFLRNGNQPYCQAIVAPKVAKFRAKFAHRLQPD